MTRQKQDLILNVLIDMAEKNGNLHYLTIFTNGMIISGELIAEPAFFEALDRVAHTPQPGPGQETIFRGLAEATKKQVEKRQVELDEVITKLQQGATRTPEMEELIK